MITLVAPAALTVDVTLPAPTVIDVTIPQPDTVDVIIPPVMMVDVVVDVPAPTGNRVVFGEFNYLWFGAQVIYGTN